MLITERIKEAFKVTIEDTIETQARKALRGRMK